jgi:hypothetical protein
MRNDPIVDEIRQARQDHADAFKGDLHAICEDIRRQERESGRRFVTLQPRPAPIVNLTTDAAVSASRAELRRD